MLGLFSTLNLGAGALQTQQQGVEVASQNLANVNNPAYARQRLVVQTAAAIRTTLGPQGTGITSVAIEQMRSALLDGQIQSELSVGGYVTAQQDALENAQTRLGEDIDLQSSSSSTSATPNGLAKMLQGFFDSLQELSSNPSSISARQSVLDKAQQLATQFNHLDDTLAGVDATLNQSIGSELDKANSLMANIADLNQQIQRAEVGASGKANDLRDVRQQKLEELSKLVNVTAVTDATGAMNISTDGQLLVSGQKVLDTLQSYDAGGGQMLVRTTTGATQVKLTGGSVQGTIDVRDGALADLQKGLDKLAGNLITQVNNIHRNGYNLNDGTGADFFTGTDAGSIQVNAALVGNPALVQAADAAGVSGNNKVALALAQLGDTKLTALGQQTFGDSYAQTVAALGQSLANAKSQVADHETVQNMLTQQRSSVSGVSLDEEMTELMKYQKAFQAAAKLVTTISEMLDEVVNLKR